jgi:hypothetical protein
MKRICIITLVAAGLVLGISAQSFANDWGNAGKALAIIEGVRVVTGGAVDVIGNIAGINKPRQEAREHRQAKEVTYIVKEGPPRYYPGEYRYYAQPQMVWVPNIVWRQSYVPEHTEYRPGYGEVIVRGHYESCQVEEGGHWEQIYTR